jgi:FMN reductase
MAVTANSSQPLFDADGLLVDQAIAAQLDIMTGQVVDFARMKRAYADNPHKAAAFA